MAAKHASHGIVYLVGAGPGDPELLTLRAVECLQRADLVLYDRLVDPRTLEHAPNAEHACVGELHGPHAARQAEWIERMISEARAGKKVVRLKGGDPGIFGRLADEAGALAAAGVPFEIVPGVTAALAAGAYAGIPLTHRAHASAVAFVTGHECPAKPCTLDWPALARFPGTLVVYMGLSRLRAIVAKLVQHGKAAETPVAVVRWASMPHQATIQATLATIADEVEHRALQPPAIMIVGPVVDQRAALEWFEKRPLFGKRVLVTRPAGQAAEMRRELEELGASVYELPAVEIGPAPDPAAVEAVLERLHEYDWLVFTSVNGVRTFMAALLHSPDKPSRDLRLLGRLNIAAIGPRTADALRSFYLEPDVVPTDYRSEALVEALTPRVRDEAVLLVRADRGRELLCEELSRVCQVEEIAVYAQTDAIRADPEVLDLLRSGQIDYVTLTSSNIARAFVRLLDEACLEQLRGRTKLVTISPVTSAAVRALGLEVAAEARVYTAAGVVEAILAVSPRAEGERSPAARRESGNLT